MKDSIEERMLAVQESKASMGKGSFAKLKKAELEKAKLTAMRDLFQVDDDAVNSWDVLQQDGGEAFLADEDEDDTF